MDQRRKRDHVTVDVSTEHLLPTSRHRTFWRWWRQLSRLQRSLVYMSVVVTLTVLYFLCGNGLPVVEVAQGDEPESLRIALGPEVPEIPEIPDEPDARADQVLDEPEAADTKDEYLVIQTPHVGVGFEGPANERQQAVVDAFRHAWRGYKRHAWGHDHLRPISEGFHDWFGLGLTIVDALDTIHIMGLQQEYSDAKEWVEKSLTFDNNRDVNLFEVTIRILGGLLSTYHLTGEKMFLEKATDLGDRLLPSFETESGVPYSDINLFTRKAHAPKWSPDSSTSEVTTIQLEFRALSRSTGDPKYEEAAARVSEHIHKLEKKDGLVPIFINANSGKFRTYSTITLGARGDSYYEYLLKQWIQTGRTVDYLKDDYVQGIDGVQKHLTYKTVPNGLTFIGELLVGGKDFKPKMDHLTCYLPGTLALGTHYGMPQRHLKLAEELLYTCYQTYAQQPTFLAPEITYFNIQGENSNDLYVKTNDAHNLLRPEFVESLWYMYQITGNATYQDWGWEVFGAFERHARVANGYTSIGNVRNTANVRPKDSMESFFLSETLKYFYLLFSADRTLLDIDRYVVNSEAHPLPIYSS